MSAHHEDESSDALYGDLQQDLKIAAAAPKSQSVLALEKELKEHQETVRRLTEENESLKRNIGTLFRTARAELKRKDDRIEALTQQLEQHNCT